MTSCTNSSTVFSGCLGSQSYERLLWWSMCGFLGLDIKEAYDRLNRAVLLTATPFRRASKDISLDRVVVGLQY